MLEVADVFHRHGPEYRQAHGDHLGGTERRVMAAIEACRTATLGGHAEQCTDCGFVRYAYDSCRDRHCPKCQGLARAEWLEARQADLLPVPYFHVVFTVPAPVADIAFYNKEVVYSILFRASAEALLDTRIRYATRDANRCWVTQQSSFPWLEGWPMWTGAAFDPRRQLLETITGVERAMWRLTDASEPPADRLFAANTTEGATP